MHYGIELDSLVRNHSLLGQNDAIQKAGTFLVALSFMDDHDWQRGCFYPYHIKKDICNIVQLFRVVVHSFNLTNETKNLSRTSQEPQ